MNKLVDTEQSCWDLAAIQLSGWTSLPILATSILILQNNSFLGAVLTTIVGNAILWFIRLGIISMSFEKRLSTLDLSREYLGKVGGYFIAIVLLVSTFSWFVVQTTAAGNTITHLLSIHEDPQIDQFVQASVFLGLVSTLLCMGGIVLLRRLSLVSFPIIVIAFLLVLYALPEGLGQNTNPLSLSGLTLVLATNLGVSADMPTFFRHSKSKLAAIQALTVVQVISLVFGLASLFLGSVTSGLFELNENLILDGQNQLLRFSLVVFVFITAICTNVANVYSASVGWELIAPRSLIGRKEYLILGLGLTIIFILISNIFSPVYLLSISDCALVNLCLVFICSYFLPHRYKQEPNFQQKWVYFIAWLVATSANAIQFLYNPASEAWFLIISLGLIIGIVGISHIALSYAKQTE